MCVCMRHNMCLTNAQLLRVGLVHFQLCRISPSLHVRINAAKTWWKNVKRKNTKESINSSLVWSSGGWWFHTRASRSPHWGGSASRPGVCLRIPCSQQQISLCSTRATASAESPGKGPRWVVTSVDTSNTTQPFIRDTVIILATLTTLCPEETGIGSDLGSYLRTHHYLWENCCQIQILMISFNHFATIMGHGCACLPLHCRRALNPANTHALIN